jgi:hypothetical protein
MQRMVAQGQSSVRPKVIFELKSFVCGAAVWRISSNLQLRFIRANHTFEIYHGGNSLSAMHPDVSVECFAEFTHVNLVLRKFYSTLTTI